MNLTENERLSTLDASLQQNAPQTLTNRVALISGSSSGIGLAIARELSSRGAFIILNYPFPALESSTITTANALPTRALAICADMSTPTGPADLVAAAVAEFGHLDIIVNNAALAINMPFEEQGIAQFDALVALNARGPFLLTQAALPHLRCADKGGAPRIINIVSASSRAPPPFQTIYAGTKGMVDSFTRVWAKELPPKYSGLTVNAVSPGPTRTEGFADAGEEMMKVLQPTIDLTPAAKRMGESSEIAFAVACLCEERARWLNGVHLHANGGFFVE